eukprot:CAMPEP_0197829396 /NCGR_PEP_ID=MMETSP1437-20131217/5839_1 /TAXON_ID=49252 ORGANISM="Eucampia antarctica, Strain CCMP1452" /NCGR_SAMPLE_ID=MMETSP1437 /ASSEMBLY_ACC=CAM_ASM_001096 /LENGTH=454 /DNA_ID=CAMNT_0043431033 /DNA_START=94 /DNA_END=1458 /DNA_ORIENTATION=-
MKVSSVSLCFLIAFVAVDQHAFAFTSQRGLKAFVGTTSSHQTSPKLGSIMSTLPMSKTSLSSSNENSANLAKAPTFNGKMVMPMKIMKTGLQGHKVAAVYAVLNNQHRRGKDGWENCEYVGITKDLNSILQSQLNQHGSDKAAHVRALSFAYPQKTAMAEIAEKWREVVRQSGGQVLGTDAEWAKITVTAEQMQNIAQEEEKEVETIAERSEDEINTVDGLDKIDEDRREEVLRIAMFDDDDDDDDDFDDEDEENFVADFSQSTVIAEEESEDVVSPFSNSEETALVTPDVTVAFDDGSLEFNKENVDKILNEIRPYLISDGGNVSVQSVDEETRNVYLVLEGACGSCPSSTVTMQMGIQRVLNENFENLGEVLQVEENSDDDSTADGLTLEAVQSELKRIAPAITAMGGVVEIVNVDPIGVVELQFRGSTKIQQGLELAILDVPFVKHVKFVN